MKKRIAVVLVVLAVDVACHYAFRKNLPWFARRGWKRNAVATVEGWLDNKNWLPRRLDAIKQDGYWNRRSIVQMKSGEWFVYCANTHHDDRLVNDIIIGKGSDGNWHYSSLHFCVLWDDVYVQPPDLRWFLHEYNFRQFDGKSDECLKKTAPFPASYGAAR